MSTQESVEEVTRKLRELIVATLGKFSTVTAVEGMRQAATSVAETLSLREDKPKDYYVAEVTVEGDIVRVGVGRNFVKHPATEEEYVALFDTRPREDDLDRLNCTEIGKIGHVHCGLCFAHQKPRFLCGCIYKGWE